MNIFTTDKMRKCKAEGYVCEVCEWKKLCLRSSWRCTGCDKGATYHYVYNVVFGK